MQNVQSFPPNNSYGQQFIGALSYPPVIKAMAIAGISILTAGIVPSIQNNKAFEILPTKACLAIGSFFVISSIFSFTSSTNS